MPDEIKNSLPTPSEKPSLKSQLRRIPLVAGITLLAVAGLIISIIAAYYFTFGAPKWHAEPELFAIPLNASEQGVVDSLYDKGFIRTKWAFNVALDIEGRGGKIQPGSYKISKSDSPWAIVEILMDEPYLRWVVIPEGLRKEQIAEVLGKALDWGEETKTKWITTYTAMNFDTLEGVFFPDTYLIPADEKPLDAAERLLRNFNEKFAPYSQEALNQNIKWTTLLKVASLIQREAGGKADMPIISAVIWNRLDKNMRLEIDATIQYIRDDLIHYGKAPSNTQPASYSSEGTWWAPITPADKDIQSPYNTYRNFGLPPHPIANPGLDAIDAALHPADSQCLYYLHDADKQIHCANTYEEHLKNIKEYLQ